MKSRVFCFGIFLSVLTNVNLLVIPKQLTTEGSLSYAAIQTNDDDNDGVLVHGDCAFLVNSDLNDPAPLFTRHNVYELIVPEPTDTVLVKNGELLDMYCTESFAPPFNNVRKLTAQCLQQKYFLVNDTIHPFSDFSCTAWPTFNARRTGRPCNGGTDLVEVGFEIDDGKGFLQAYDVCHDESNEVTRYVHHVLYPSSYDYQHGVARPAVFITLDFYGGRDVNSKYTQVQQNKTISNILGLDATPYFNYSQDLILSRGHMVAKTDQIFGAAQMATFLFINVAPQWQSFNGGNWERVETGVRKFVADQDITTDCYTGTWGISTLPDVNGIEQELYLDFDENNNGLIPVPKLYYRIVIDRLSRRGIVLIGVNNPWATLEQIKRDYILCQDIGDKITWLSWYKEDLHEGYSYACSVPDFISVVEHLPHEELHTTGLLGIGDEYVVSTTTTTASTPIVTTEGPITSSSTITTEGPITSSSTLTTDAPTTPSPAQCYFNVNGDLNDPAPIFTPKGSLTFLQPNASGVVVLNAGESFDMHCTSYFIVPFQSYNQLTATCVAEQQFTVNEKQYRFAAFSCMNWPKYEARRTGVDCEGGMELIEIGLPLDAGFMRILEVCHEDELGATHYAQHELTPPNVNYQRIVPQPNVLRGDFYDGRDIAKLYTQAQQNVTFNALLGLDASTSYLDSTLGYYLIAGQLADKRDFIYGAAQRATHYYVNTAPQWQSVQSGNWRAIEVAVRNYIANNKLNATIYTGNWAIATLSAADGQQRALYLDAETYQLPVPKIFYRIVIDQATRKGIVLIAVNNPHAELNEILQNYVVCNDVGEQLNWLDWQKSDIPSGYAYACAVDDFLKTVQNLPADKLKTSGLLGIDDKTPIIVPTCSFRVNGDLKDPAPLFLLTNAMNGALTYIEPNPEGVVVLDRYETLDMYCGKSFVAPFTNHVKLTATCYADQTYTVNGTYYNFNEFVCTSWPTYTARRTGRPCNGGTDLAEIGFELDAGFLHTFDVCHDELHEVTRYVHHVLYPASAQYQRSVSRPSFITGDFYDARDVNNKYTQIQQNITISEILGMDASPYFDISSDVYLARGHLAAKTDFIFGAPQKATFFFINAAPQWQTFNGGNWERVEDSVRKFVATENITVDCYTGTWGIATLPDVHGVPQELYLDFDVNNNGLIPVPRLYYRVIIDRLSRKGIVLIGINNPHASLAEIQQDYIICPDIGDEITWLSWSKNDLRKGYSYACTVPDFIEVVQDLPIDDLTVSGVLGI